MFFQFFDISHKFYCFVVGVQKSKSFAPFLPKRIYFCVDAVAKFIAYLLFNHFIVASDRQWPQFHIVIPESTQFHLSIYFPCGGFQLIISGCCFVHNIENLCPIQSTRRISNAQLLEILFARICHRLICALPLTDKAVCSDRPCRGKERGARISRVCTVFTCFFQINKT